MKNSKSEQFSLRHSEPILGSFEAKKTEYTLTLPSSQKIHLKLPFAHPKLEIKYASETQQPLFKKLRELVEEQKQKYGFKDQVTCSGLISKKGELILAKSQNVDISSLSNLVQNNQWKDLAIAWAKSQKITEDDFAKTLQDLPEIMEQNGTCLRGGLKKFHTIETGTGYELCKHCQGDNHSEAQLLFAYFNQLLPSKQQIFTEAELLNLLKKIDDQETVVENQELHAKLVKAREKLKNTTLLLWGHWWGCSDCSRKIAATGIKTVVINTNWIEENKNLISGWKNV